MRNIMSKVVLFLVLPVIFVSFMWEEAVAINRTFLLDTSGSMRRSGFFDKVKETLETDYVSKMKAGEHIIILTYDEEVVILVDQRIEGEGDLKEITSIIDNLEATGLWTWMTKALEMTMEQARRMKSQYPQEPLIIYFLTDGINDPPPAAKEPMLKFVEVLWKYFEDFEIEGTYVYVLVYREEGQPPAITEEDEERIEGETEGRVRIEPSSPDEPIPSEIYIEYSDFDFGSISPSKREVTRRGSIGIKEIKGEVEGKTIELSCETDPFPQFISFKVEPENFKVLGEGQIEKIVVSIPQNISPGEYMPYLKLSSSNLLILPSKIPVKFEILEISKGNWLWKFLIFIIFFGFLLCYFLYLILRRKNLWVKREDQEETHPVRLRGVKKAALDAVGLPNYSLKVGVYPHEIFSIFLFKNGEKKEKVALGQSIKCEDSQGRFITIVFYDKPTQGQAQRPGPISAAKEEEPDFFKKKRDNKTLDLSSGKYKSDIE